MSVKGKIAEVFDSVQGEGIYLGERQLFVRFFGCNLNCDYCDTKQASFLEYGHQELLEEIKLYGNGYHSVSFTGGEPLLQKDFLKETLILFCKAGYKNYLETNGTLTDELSEVIDYVDIVAMDLKLPSSTLERDLWEVQRGFLNIASKKEVFLKVVVCLSTTDEDIAQGARLIKETNEGAILVLQPNSYQKCDALKEKLKSFKNICKKEKITACVIPQMHKAIGIK
ncbi:MAG: 7-carboxy-7-deazaguanine synthase QueE [Candidatus Omnitrophota bacterium]|nr:7-carboxy-7-deazaguanine synthase QueE [Candidatus Omnitrophota bacterium]